MTLIELLLAVMLAAILSLSAAALMRTALATWRQFDVRTGSSRSTQLGLDVLNDDVVNSLGMQNMSSGNQIAFNVILWTPGFDTKTVNYSWSGISGDPIQRSENFADTITVLDHVDSFNVNFLSATRSAYRLKDESQPLNVRSQLPVFIFDENRPDYAGALATSPGADSSDGIITLATGGYALATRGGSGGTTETGPFFGGDVVFTWNAPTDTDHITDVSLFLRTATTTGDFIDTFVDLALWTDTGKQSGLWTAGNDGSDGFASSVVYPTALRTLLSDPVDNLLRVATDRFRAFVAQMDLYAYQYAIVTIFSDDLNTNFTKWIESPVPGAGYFLRSDPPEDAPMNMAIVTNLLDSGIHFLFPADTTASSWGDYKADFDLWMPLAPATPGPDSRVNAVMDSYASGFDGEAIGAIPATWVSGPNADFKVEPSLVNAGRSLRDDTRAGNGMWLKYSDTAYWSDTVDVSFDVFCATGADSIFFVLYSRDTLYSNRSAGQSPPGAIVVSIDHVSIGNKLRFHAWLGNGAGAPLISVGSDMDFPFWKADIDSGRVRFVLYQGVLKIYQLSVSSTVPQFTVKGFTAVVPTTSNYFGMMAFKGSTPGLWDIDNLSVNVRRTPPGIGGTLEANTVFSDDFEDDADGGIALPDDPGWFTEFAGKTFFDITKTGSQKFLSYQGNGNSATQAPLYFNYPVWNSTSAERFAVELDIHRTAIASAQVYVILASPGFHPDTGNAARFNQGVRMVRLEEKSGNKLQLAAVWGTGAGITVSSTFDATHLNNKTERFRFEMDDRTLRIYNDGVLVKTWANVYPDDVISNSAGFDGMDNTKTISYDRVAAYHGGFPGTPLGYTYVVARYEDTANYYRVRLWPDPPAGEVVAQVEQVVAGVVTSMGGPAFVTPVNSVQTIKLTMDADRLSLLGPDSTLTATCNGGLTRGKFGFAAGLCHAHYDKITVKTFTGEADMYVRYASDSDYIALRMASTAANVDLRLVRSIGGRERLLSESKDAFATKLVIPIEVKMLPNDSIVVKVDTGAGLRQVIATSTPVGNSISAGPIGFSVGTTQVNFDDFVCTNTATFSSGIAVQLQSDDGSAHDIAWSDTLAVSDLSSDFEEYVFSFPKVTLDPNKTYLFRIMPDPDGIIGNVTADVATFLPVNYSSPLSRLDENNATYGVAGANTPWKLRYGYNGTEVVSSDVKFNIWDEVTLPVNGRIIRQDRLSSGLLYDIVVAYDGRQLHYAGGEVSENVR